MVGDSVRAFNPVYGQGLTVAAITAIALGHALTDHRRRHGADLTGFVRRFQRLVARHGADAWHLATGEDLRYQTTEGPRPGRLGRLVYWYADRVLAVANGNQEGPGGLSAGATPAGPSSGAVPSSRAAARPHPPSPSRLASASFNKRDS